MSIPGYVLAVLLVGQDTPPDVKQGIYQGKTIEYVESNGMAIVEGDIVLGPVSMFQPTAKKPVAAISQTKISPVWPRSKSLGYAEVPFEIAETDPLREEIKAAIETFNQTFGAIIQFVPNRNLPDFVTFSTTSKSGPCIGKSAIGRQGGRQFIVLEGGSCKAVILHELGHAIGLVHEHSRRDRAQHLKVNWRNIPKENRGQYQTVLESEVSGSFDFGSIMMYNNNVKKEYPHQLILETIPPGIRIWDNTQEKYSLADRFAIQRIYGDQNPQLEVVSNPPGIELTVQSDPNGNGTTLDVPRDANNRALVRLGGEPYLFARWSDLLSDIPAEKLPDPKRVIADSPGSPSQVYIANFVKLQEVTAGLQPTAPTPNGEVKIEFSPIVVGNKRYRIAGLPYNWKATPSPGYAFYRWKQPKQEEGANPITIDPQVFTQLDAQFVEMSDIAARVDTDPPRLAVTVDGKNPYFGARNYSFSIDKWARTATYKLGAALELPSQVEDEKAILLFDSWFTSSKNTNGLDLKNPNLSIRPTGDQWTARYVNAYQVKPAENTFNGNASTSQEEPCGVREFSTSASKPDYTNSKGSYFKEGTTVRIDVEPLPGWNFLGWDPPLAKNEVLVGGPIPRAILNTNTSRLAISKVDPAAIRGMSSTTLTIVGSGIDSGTRICWQSREASLRCERPKDWNPNELTVDYFDSSGEGPLVLELRNSTSDGCTVRSGGFNVEIQ